MSGNRLAVGDATRTTSRARAAGQRLFIGLDKAVLSAETKELIREIQPCGFMLPAVAFLDPMEALSLTKELAKLCDIPPFFAIDGEGGRVWRAHESATRWPSPSALGAHPTLIEDVSSAMASELRAFGINLNFAPVVEAGVAFLGDRCLSNDHTKAADLASRFITEHQKMGVCATAKHFPGHGTDSKDPHRHNATNLETVKGLLRRGWLPFQASISADVGMIMVGHIALTEVDPARPSTISSVVVPTLLRRRLGFNGVTISDDIEMSALSESFDLPEIVARATEATIDTLLVAHSKTKQWNVFKHLVYLEEREDGTARASAARLSKLKHRFLNRRFPLPTQSVIGCDSHRQLAATVSRRGKP